MINEEEEAEIYYDVEFTIQKWDGTVKYHTANLLEKVCIRELKKDLQNELGVPATSDWCLAGSNIRMMDDQLLSVYANDCDEVIRVTVYQRQQVPEMTPVMESR